MVITCHINMCCTLYVPSLELSITEHVFCKLSWSWFLFLYTGDTLNRKSLYEPSLPQRCRQLICTKGKATAIIVGMGIFILLVALIAAFARSGSRTCDGHTTESVTPTAAPVEDYIATNGEKFPWRNIRLPPSISPLEYDIYLHPNLTQRKFSGDVTIKCQVLEKTDFVVLHSRDLVVTQVSVKTLPDNDEKKITNQLEYTKNEQIYLKLESSVSSGDKILIKMHFEGKLIKKLSGFYLGTYTDSHQVIRFVVQLLHAYIKRILFF